MKDNSGAKYSPFEKEFFLSMSQKDLADLGVGDVAYVKRYTVNGKEAYVLHAANGTALAAQANESDAEQAAYGHDLELVTVH